MTNFAKAISFLTVLGGLLWTPIPFLQAMRGPYLFVEFVAIVAPLLLFSGVYGLSNVYREKYETAGSTGLIPLTVGLLGLATFPVYDALSLRGLPTGLLFSGIGFIGIVAAEIGALMFGYASWRSEEPERLFIVILPLSLPLNILFLNAILQSSIFYFSGGLYGLAWASIGIHLWRTYSQ